MAGETADVIVIGAGVVGVSCAWHLARAGAGRVLVLEKAELAAEASRRTAGLVQVVAGDPAERPLAQASLAVFGDWAARVGPEAPGFVPCGCLHLGLAADDGLGDGDVAEMVDAATMRARQPGLVVDDTARGWWEAAAGYTDGYATTMAFWWAARRAGATLREGTPVRSLVLEAGRVVGVETSLGRITAGAVVLAAGVWSARLAASAGLSPPIAPTRAQVASVAPGRSAVPRLVLIDHRQGVFVRPAPNQEALIGQTTRPTEAAHPARYRAAPDPVVVERLRALAATRLPALGAAPPVGGYAGLVDLTPDGRPLLGPAPGVAGLWLAAGFSGRGLRISPAVGAMLAAWVVDGNVDPAIARPFAPGRFGAGGGATSGPAPTTA